MNADAERFRLMVFAVVWCGTVAAILGWMPNR